VTGQSTWPAHLRDDAPSQQCGRCGRYTWSASEFDTECRMPQPDGYPCGGRFEARDQLQDLVLDIYAARYGTPRPTDVAGSLAADYVPAGRGRVRIMQSEPHWAGDPLSRALFTNPSLVITWEEHRRGCCEPGVMYSLVGQCKTADGMLVRMVAHRLSHIEHERQAGIQVTTAHLHPVDPSGGAASWYRRRVYQLRDA
jgi:hypothetical protein